MKYAEFTLWVRYTHEGSLTSLDPAVLALPSIWEGYYALGAFEACWLVETQPKEMREAGWTRGSA